MRVIGSWYTVGRRNRRPQDSNSDHWNSLAALITVFMNPHAMGINASAQIAAICTAGVVLAVSVYSELRVSFMIHSP